MDAQIIALKCPSCGNTNNVSEKEIKYGYEFTCKQCLTTSVLVINRQLYTPNPGEHICIVCGRVAASDVRFCQCGASLIRKCINPDCLKEFPVDHRLCDYCGWPQDVVPTSGAAIDIKIHRAITNLSDPDPTIQINACHALAEIGQDASPALLNLLETSSIDGFSDSPFRHVCGLLPIIGSPAVPAIVKILDKSWGNEPVRSMLCCSLAYMHVQALDAIPYLASVVENNSLGRKEALFTLGFIGHTAHYELIDLLDRCSNEEEQKDILMVLMIGDVKDAWFFEYKKYWDNNTFDYCLDPKIEFDEWPIVIPYIIKFLKHNPNDRFAIRVVAMTAGDYIPILADILVKNQDEKIQQVVYWYLTHMLVEIYGIPKDLSDPKFSKRLKEWALRWIQDYNNSHGVNTKRY